MHLLTSSVQSRHPRRTLKSRAAATPQIAIDEYELAARWDLSVRTLRAGAPSSSAPCAASSGRGSAT